MFIDRLSNQWIAREQEFSGFNKSVRGNCLVDQRAQLAFETMFTNNLPNVCRH